VEHAEALVTHAVLVFKLLVEATGAIVIAIGATAAVVELIHRRPGQRTAAFAAIRLGLARYLALGLEFQLAADILVTAVAPSWEEIGKLAAIAAIRTVLNIALAHEMKEKRAEMMETPQEAPVGDGIHATGETEARPR
jgi:uncharacterized membrane protein